MGRFHRHDDGTTHDHDTGHDHDAPHDHGEGRSHDAPHEHGTGHTPGTGHTHGTGDDHDTGHSHGTSRSHVPAHELREHGDHSGYQTGTERVQVLEAIFSENDRLAAANRADFDAAGVRVVNLMSSPGAGKTELLRQTLRRLSGDSRIGILEGDIETSIDADRLEGLASAVALVNTGRGFGGECHLDAPMVRSALPRLPLADLDLLIIENVGNLVCPAEFAVGEHVRAMVYAITEGEEKPLKYPVMFRSAEIVAINKIDLLPYLDFDLDRFRENLHTVNPTATTVEISARTGDGLDAWCDWLTGLLAARA